MAKKGLNQTEKVNAFMAELEHPFKAEVQAVREIIKNVHPGITEEVKWKAPSFSYRGYLVTFNLWATQHVHLVFHNGAILSNDSGLLEGDYVDRRMMYFSDMADIKAKQPVLEQAIREWVSLMDQVEPLQNTDFSKLAQPAQRALAGAGISRLEQLTQITETELKQLHGIGTNALKQLCAALEAKGWAFEPEN